ncbi:MAG: 3-phosphoshikimate 1-carboxyvinyltransferase [Lachnospiraceae bacterium]|nr:3-phosphoshikimate 1-carboxyvinyltransferase [Lachnospiraceae bacterium]
MKVQIKKSKLSGTIDARPSKSYAHRYLIASSLATNVSTISNVDFSNDILATLNCINSYGKKHYINYENHNVQFLKDFVNNFEPIFDCKESGTTIRLFIPIALQKYEKTTFIGTDRLIERGIDIYEKIFKYVRFDKSKYEIKTKGIINSGKYELPGNISSQYISGLLYSLPLLNGDSKIIINTEIESKNYILMTLDVLKKYSIDIDTNIDTNIDNEKLLNSNNNNINYFFHIKGNQKYMADNHTIEGDYSNAAFIDAFNYFDNNIVINGLNNSSLQSDKVYKEYFNALNNKYCEIDIANCIDLGPILITFAALKNGARFINTKRLKIKESDRGTVIAKELTKLGADIEIFDNEIIVNKKELHKPDTTLYSHNDHRIAMSLSLLSTMYDIEIDDSECVSKSYPNYFDDLKKLGAILN